jgi:glycosyltransferase involved in cell wall biosynthesis
MQKVNNKSINIFISSFDWDDLAQNNPEEIIKKLERDKLHPDKNHFLILSWGPGRYEKNISPNIRVIRRSARVHFLRPFYDVLTFFIAPSIAIRNDIVPDLFLAYDFPMAVALSRAARHFKAPLILGLTNLPHKYLRTRPQWFISIPYLWFTQRLALRFISAVYTINDVCKKYAMSLGIPKERIVIFISDTIARERAIIESARTGVVRAKFNIPDDKKIFFSAARLEHEKGMNRLIKAFSQLQNKNTVLVIAGKGSLLGELERQAKALNIEDRVLFAGSVSREEIWSFYKDSDIFILLSYEEALGLVFWEAMYVGTPVIGSYAEGIVETVGSNEERGFLWEPKDGISALEERTRICLNESDQRNQRIKQAKEYVEEKINNEIDIRTLYSLCKKK